MLRHETWTALQRWTDSYLQKNVPAAREYFVKEMAAGQKQMAMADFIARYQKEPLQMCSGRAVGDDAEQSPVDGELITDLGCCLVTSNENSSRFASKAAKVVQSIKEGIEKSTNGVKFKTAFWMAYGPAENQGEGQRLSKKHTPIITR